LRPSAIISRHRSGFPARSCLLSSVLCVLFFAGCSSVPHRTRVEPRGTELPARLISNFFTVESKWDDGKTYRFLIDTGSSATLVSTDLARRFAFKPKKNAGAARVRVRSANGGELELEPVTLRRVALGETSFEGVPALVFDFTDLSDQLGLRIDGIIGFPLFRDTLLTLDYPGRRLVLAPATSGPAVPPKSAPRIATLAFNHEHATPLIPVQMGTESFIVLIDSGSYGSLGLNPAGLHPRFASGPRPGPLISSLQGDRQQFAGRLNQNILIGTHTITQPIVEITDQLSSIGGELLQHFMVSFDQHRNLVTFVRDPDGAITMEPRRNPGLSFARSPVYWRVLSVIPETPAAALPVQAGDLCVRINGELVARWTFDRYAELVNTAALITFTFLRGAKEVDLEVPVAVLVP